MTDFGQIGGVLGGSTRGYQGYRGGQNRRFWPKIGVFWVLFFGGQKKCANSDRDFPLVGPFFENVKFRDSGVVRAGFWGGVGRAELRELAGLGRGRGGPKSRIWGVGGGRNSAENRSKIVKNGSKMADFGGPRGGPKIPRFWDYYVLGPFPNMI
jgi:hypothetical protein